MERMVRICVTGTPGTGKTEVGRRLAKELGWRFVEVNDLVKKARASTGMDRERGSVIVDPAKLRSRVRAMERCVLAGHFAHDLPCDCIVVLRCGLPELRRRLKKRLWSERKVRENVQAELFGVIEEEAAAKRVPLIVVDTARKEPEQVVREILRKLGA